MTGAGVMPEATYRLSLGDLDLSPLAQPAGAFVEVYMLRRGKAEPVVTSFEASLRDGAVEELIRHNNRDINLVVALSGPNSDALAVLEEKLALEVAKGYIEFAWTPPDGAGATTVFDVLWGDVGFDDDDELWDLLELEGKRVFPIALRCWPFGRSDRWIRVQAGAVAGGADTQINACDSLTGISGAAGLDTSVKYQGTGSVLVNGATIAYTAIGGGSYYKTVRGTLTFSGLSVNLTTTPFVTIKADTNYKTSQSLRMWIDGVEAPSAGNAYSGAGSGFRTFAFRSTDSSVSEVVVEITETYVVYNPTGKPADEVPPSGVGTRLDDLRRGPTPPALSTSGRESTVLLPMYGSARTEGTIEISHATQGLGDVLVYSNPLLGVLGYTPDLRRYASTLTGGSTGPSYISGGFSALDITPGTTVFQVPAEPLPEGSYMLVAASPAGFGVMTGPINVTVRLKAGATTLASRTYSGLTPVQLGTTNFVTLGSISLPPAIVADGSSALVELDITKVNSGDSWQWDEFFIFHVADNMALTVIAAGSGTKALGTANNRAWIDAPTLKRPNGAIFVGTDASRIDAYHAGQVSPVWNPHLLVPPNAPLFVVTSGAANPTIGAVYPPRWIHNARNLDGVA